MLKGPRENTDVDHVHVMYNVHVCDVCIYRYIKGLESDSQYMSTLKSSREIRQSHQLAPSRVRPTDWIDAQALKDKKDSASLVDALWALRDQLLQDSLNIDGSGLDK